VAPGPQALYQPGWYPDPWQQAPLRYFDGTTWSHVTSGRTTAQDESLKYVLPIGRTGLSIAAGYAGLFAILLIPAPIALVLGILALADLKKKPGALGKGRALFGVISGGLFTALLVVLIVAAALK
jgi:hypothetical protein